MADKKPDDAPKDDADSDADEPQAKGSKRRRTFILVALALGLCAVGGGAVYVFLDPELSARVMDLMPEDDGSEEVEIPEKLEFAKLREIIADLRSPREITSFIRLKMSLQVTTREEKSWIKNIEPRIADAVQLYLRQHTRDEFIGDEGTQRARTELLAIINQAAKPVKIKGIFFREFLVR